MLATQGHASRESDPETLFRSIEQHFVSGQLALADAEASRAVPAGDEDGALWAAKFRVQRARVWVYQGRYRDALALLEPPLPAAASDQSLAITRNTLLSIAYRRTNQLAGANQSLRNAETLCSTEAACGEVRLAQGVVDVENDQLTDATHAFELTLADAHDRDDSFLRMQALLNLGVVSLRQEHYDDALERFADASTVARSLGARLALEKATGNVGWALYKLGDYQNALQNSQLAALQAAALGAPVDQVRWLNDAGLSQYRLGDLQAARASYQHSLELARSIQNTEETGDALVALATLDLRTGNLSEALEHARGARQLAEKRNNASDTLRPSLIEAVVLEKQGQTTPARDQLLALEQKSSIKPSVQWEVQNALAELAASTGDNPTADTWYRRAIATYTSQRASVANIDSRLPFIENGEMLYRSYMEHLIAQGKTDEGLAVLDQGRAETLAEGLNTRPGAAVAGDPRALAQRNHATILVYCLRPDTSYLWAVSPARIGFFRLPGQETLLPLIDRYSRAIRSSQDVLAQQNSPGTALYRELIEPAGSLIRQHGTVFVIADEGMYGLNFETLLAPGPQPHFWIEDVTLLNARSLSLLAHGATEHAALASKRLLLIGDPVYNRPEFQSLPHAREEISEVAQHFQPTRRLVLTGTEATPAAYPLSKPADFAYIHFVSHGVGNQVDPLDSAVVLSPNPGAAASYKLYAREILNQKLHADLVTISSCYGSGVRSYSGEGLVGLTWAFLRAGSHNVIGALWEVNDTSTPRLMNDLYDGLASGNAPPSALRAAKLSMLHRSDVFRKPFYWAPFQLYAGA